jgi:hypothetical protein
MANQNALPPGTTRMYPARYQLQFRHRRDGETTLWQQEGAGSNNLLAIQRRCQFRCKWAMTEFRVWDRIAHAEVPVP